MVRWLVLGAAVLVLFGVGGPTVLAKVPELRERATEALAVDEEKSGQSASQLSAFEFAQMRRGTRPSQVRALVGEPEARSRNEVEGLELECWYYGIVGASGSYQFCFANGQLALKFRYAA
jgi:hypothetical protein